MRQSRRPQCPRCPGFNGARRTRHRQPPDRFPSCLGPLSFGPLLLPLVLINHHPPRRVGWISTVGTKLTDQQQLGCQPASGGNDRHRKRSRVDCQLVHVSLEIVLDEILLISLCSISLTGMLSRNL